MSRNGHIPKLSVSLNYWLRGLNTVRLELTNHISTKIISQMRGIAAVHRVAAVLTKAKSFTRRLFALFIQYCCMILKNCKITIEQ